jgi:calcineurin-like phosphoesterase family protein
LLPHRLGGHDVLVCHFPYAGDSQDHDRYSRFRPVDDGLPIIHGHVHTSFAELGRQFNVGVDVRDYRPVAESTITDWLDGLPEPLPEHSSVR